jgi:hypothetical protein
MKLNSFQYKVGEHITCNKINAILKNEETKQGISFITPFEDFDFSQEPTESFNELLKQQFNKLRQNNNYIKFYYSGGIDSHILLDFCFKNNIMLDEIICLKSGLPDADYEIDQYAIPFLKKHQNSIKSKITIKELTIENYLEHYKKTLQDHLNSNYSAFHNYIRCFWPYDFYGQQYDPATLHIRAMDKPTMVYENNNWYVYFLDGDLEPHENNFQFFGNSPNIIAKQCHTFINQSNTNLTYNQLCETMDVKLGDYNQPVKQLFFGATDNIVTYKGRNIRYQHPKEKKAILFCIENYPDIVDMWITYLDQLKNYIPSHWWEAGAPEMGTVGILSKFFCLTKKDIKTVDELYPAGFKPSKIATF